jgi:hypothetical protein
VDARPRRGVHQTDLPLRLTITGAGEGRFHYLILRNDGTVAEGSSASFDTEDKARVVGLGVLRRRRLAAKLTPLPD